jgi:benzoylformate decarboxylase
MDIGLSPESLERAAQLLAGAKRPVIVAGHAVADADAVCELVSLAEAMAAPVYTGNETKLIFPSDHPLYCGLVFQQSFALRRLAASADVLLEIGSGIFKYDDPVDTPIVSSDTRVIQIDLDPQALARFCSTEMALLANPKPALGALAAAVGRLIPSKERADRLERLTIEHRRRKAFVETSLNTDFRAVPIRWGAAFKEIAAALPQDAVVVDELASFYGQLPKVIGFRTSGSYFSTVDSLGWGVPAALGVALGSSGKPVIAVLGDGGAMFCIQALWSAARYQIPAVMVIFNNGGFGSMRGLFTYYGQAVASPMDSADCATYDIGELSFANLASDFGIAARRVTDPTQIRSVMQEMIGLRKPALIELMVSPEGAGMNEMTAEFFK